MYKMNIYHFKCLWIFFLNSQFDRCEAMLVKLNEIWNNFLKSVSTNMKGFVSLNHLGRFLRHLSCNGKY
jgi:hypothetical protein